MLNYETFRLFGIIKYKYSREWLTLKDCRFESLVVNDELVNFKGNFEGVGNEYGPSVFITFDDPQGAKVFKDKYSVEEGHEYENGWKNKVIVNSEEVGDHELMMNKSIDLKSPENIISFI